MKKTFKVYYIGIFFAFAKVSPSSPLNRHEEKIWVGSILFGNNLKEQAWRVGLRYKDGRQANCV